MLLDEPSILRFEAGCSLSGLAAGAPEICNMYGFAQIICLFDILGVFVALRALMNVLAPGQT